MSRARTSARRFTLFTQYFESSSKGVASKEWIIDNI